MEQVRNYDPGIGVHPQGAALIEQYMRCRSFPEIFGYEAEISVPRHHTDVWKVLMQIQYFSYWFYGHRSSNSRTDLPTRFGPGQPLPDPHGILIECEPSKRFVFRHYDAFFRLDIEDFGPAQTRLKLRCFDLADRMPGFFSQAILSLAGKREMDQSFDIQATYARLVRLKHLCDDLEEYGHPINSDFNHKLYWIQWHHTDGVFCVLPDQNGAREMKIGSQCRKGKAGYVRVDQDAGEPVFSEDHLIKNWYVEVIDGTLRKVLKKHGDRVARYDRLFLIELP